MDSCHRYFWWLGRSLGLEGLIMIDHIKDYFRLPSPKEIALKELNEANRRLLETLSAKEYAQRMCDYHSDRIKRLSAYLRDES
jgi:hypothetical protein